MGRAGDVPRGYDRFDGDAQPPDDSGCTILHADMDAFFASVEIRRNPDLRGRPVVVGGQQRGVVAAASYEARKYGVRSAMPMTQALRLCPHLVVIPPDGAAYREVSQQVMAILRDVTPLVQPLSVDEAFLDVSGAAGLFGSPSVIAARIRQRVRDELGLTCSVGVASTKFVAKLASARCKPDGLLVIPQASTLQFLHPLPVTVIWGVGAKTAEILHRLGIRTVADLAATPLDTLVRALGPAQATHIHELSQGIDTRRVETGEAEKSISAEHTLARDISDPAEVNRELLRLSEEVGRRLRGATLLARTVGIKIRFGDFRTITRVRTLPDATDSTATLHAVATDLYRDLELIDPEIRLVGVRAENLLDPGSTPQQLALNLSEPGAERPGPASDGRAAARSAAAERVLDAARARFGPGGLGYASLLGVEQRLQNLDKPAEP